MKRCKNCGLSMGDTATFCPVCCTLADPEGQTAAAEPAPASAGPASAGPASSAPAGEEPAVHTAADLETEARACETSDPARAAALYRQAIVERLDAGEDLLTDRSARRDVQRLFDRLSLVLKRDGKTEEALEEIDAAAYLGLVDGDDAGTKAQRDALARRRESLRRAVARSQAS